MVVLKGARGSSTARAAPVLQLTDALPGHLLSNHASCAGCGTIWHTVAYAARRIRAIRDAVFQWQHARAREAQSRMHARLHACSARVPENIRLFELRWCPIMRVVSAVACKLTPVLTSL